MFHKTMWQSAEKEIPNNLLLALGVCDEPAFPNTSLHAPYANLPINSALRFMKGIKTCSRSTFAEERFSDLAADDCYALVERFEVKEICETSKKTLSGFIA